MESQFKFQIKKTRTGTNPSKRMPAFARPDQQRAEALAFRVSWSVGFHGGDFGNE